MQREICHAVRPTKTSELVASLEDDKKGERETKALQALKAQMVRFFKNDQKPQYWEEASMLSKVASKQEFLDLILGFSKAIADGQVLDLDVLRYFATCLRWNTNEISCTEARYGHILDGLNEHLKRAERFNEPKTVYLLVCTIGTLLDAMVDIKITGLDRVSLHEPLKERLDALSHSEEPRTAQAASYALQALRRVPDNEGSWEAFFRYSGNAIEAAAKIGGGVAKLDPEKFVEAGPDMIKLFVFLTGVAKGGKEIWDTREDLKQIGKAMVDVSARRGWYGALRQTGAFILSGAFDGLKKTLPELNCLKKAEFWCGLYSQLERQWMCDQSSRAWVVEFMEWTFSQQSLRVICFKSDSVQKWVSLVSDSIGQLQWKSKVPKRKRGCIDFFGRSKTFDPQLKSFPQESHAGRSDGGSHLFEEAMQHCEEAQIFYADALIAQHYISGNLLHVKRLSRDEVPMESCYINLSLIESQDTEERQQQGYGFSLEERLKAEAPRWEKEVSLQDLFKSRKLRNGRHEKPSRILIRGRAGVGKTTLCKKITHAFLHNRLWQSDYDRIIWIPLRRLRNHAKLEFFLRDEIFKNLPSNDVLREALSETLNDPKDTRTLFVLDGLDEMIDVRLQGDGESLVECLKDLLNRRNVIITSRPYAVFPSRLSGYDLEIETVGFRNEQIASYVNNVISDTAQRAQIMEFIEQNWIMRRLMQIPIQLDALCFIWGEPSIRKKPLTTISALYQEIEIKLWHKDMVYMNEMTEYKADKHKTLRQIHEVLGDEIGFIRSIAFFGIYNNVTEFDWDVRQKFYPHSDHKKTDTTLDKISFLRSSDSSGYPREQDYYFLHLTFQGYFAAQYFAECWELGKALETVDLGSGRMITIQPADFISQEKYNGRYLILWRFVTGILKSAGVGHLHLTRFLEQIAGKPRDLLRAAHCRILMHCFNEIDKTAQRGNLQSLRESMDAELAWVFLIQATYRQAGKTLGDEMEFPEDILLEFLGHRSFERQELALGAIRWRSWVTPTLVEKVSAFLTSKSLQSRWYAGYIIGRNPHCPKIVSDAIRSEDGFNAGSVADGLESHHSPLSEDILRAVIYSVDMMKSSAILRNQSHLPATIVQDLASQLTSDDHRAQMRSIWALAKHPEYDRKINETIVAIIDHGDWDMKAKILEFFEYHHDLPASICLFTFSRLHVNSKYSSSDRKYFFDLLTYQHALPSEVIEGMWEMLNDRNYVMYLNWIVQILQRHGPISPDRLLKCLKGSDGEFKDELAIAVTENFFRNNSRPPQYALDHCISIATSGSSNAARRAINALQECDSLPDDALTSMWPDLDDPPDSKVISIFKNQREAPQIILDYIERLIQTQEDLTKTRRLLVDSIESSAKLPDRILITIVRLLQEGGVFNIDFFQVLEHQEKLSSEIVESLMEYLLSSDPEVRWRAERVLCKHADFETVLPRYGPEYWVPLFKLFARELFHQGNFCLMNGNYFHISLSGRTWKINIEPPEQRQKLEAALKAMYQDIKVAFRFSSDELGLGTFDFEDLF